jgi:hypothetical protein
VFKPVSVTLFEDHALIANMATSQITECKLYGNHECKMFDLSVFNANNLVVAQESRQKQISNVCADHKCSLLCVAAETGPKCLCDNGKFVAAEVKCPEVNEVGSTTANLQKQLQIFFYPQTIQLGMQLNPHSLEPIDEPTTIGEVFLTFFTCLVAIALVSVVLYVVYKRRLQHGHFNIGMHFHNAQFSNIDNAQVKMCARPVHQVYPGSHSEIILDNETTKPGVLQAPHLQTAAKAPSPTYTSFQRSNYNVNTSVLEEYSDSDSMRDIYDTDDKQKLII